MTRHEMQSPMIQMLESRVLLSAGSIDTTFGTNGVANPVTTGNGAANLVQSDGKTVVVGTTGGSKASATIARYNLDGTLDKTFGPNHNGIVTVHSGDADKPCKPMAVTEQDDGSILVAETINFEQGDTVSDQLGIIRLTPQGVLDKTFDSDGRVNITLGDYCTPNSIAVDPNGKILIAGEQDTFAYLGKPTVDAFLVRVNANGSEDNSFSGDGKLTVGAPDSFSAVAIDRTGNSSTNPFYNTIVAAGGDGTKVMIYRFKTNGSLNTAFDDDGYVSITVPGETRADVAGMVIQGDGKIVLSGTGTKVTTFSTTAEPLLARFLQTGPLDGTFGQPGSGGWVKTDLGGSVDVGFGVSRSLAGNLIVLGLKGATGFDGLQYTGGTFKVLSFSSNGILDTTFGSSGIASLPTNFRAAKLVTGPGRRISVVGTGGAFQATRLLDKGAMLAGVYSISPAADEAGKKPAHILVTLSERLPVSTRIYLGVSGTATSPLSMLRTFIDYSTNNIVYATILNGGKTYVDIPANQTYVDITLTPNDDARIEGTEQAVFTVLPSPGYDIGAPGSVSIDILDNDSKTVGPTADAYVKDGSSTNTNFGTATSLFAQKSSTNQISYLKFDLSSVSTITFGQLRLYGNLVGGASNLEVGIYGVTSTSWTETGIKNSNKPAINSTKITSATMPDAIARWYYFDLTAYLKAQKAAGHNTVTLAVQMVASNSTYAQFTAREAVTNRAQLVLG